VPVVNTALVADVGEHSSWRRMRGQLDLLIGDKRRLVVALALTSIVSGFTEAGILAIVAQVAASLVSGAHEVNAKLGFVHLHTDVGTVIWVGLALTLLRLLLQWPLSTVPVRIASDVQASLRRRVFGAFTRASWGVQSRDREGQLQEIMTSQTSQATAGALQATSLITALLTFLILMGSAVALSVIGAAIVFVIAIVMFVLLRPLRSLGSSRSRALSAAQVEYAGGIAESNRLAEEAQVFGVTGAQYVRVAAFIERCRELFYRTQVIAKLVPNLYQSLIYLVLILGLAALHSYGSGHAGSLGAVVLLLVRASQNGQQVQASYQALQQSLPFIERLQESERRYAESAPVDEGQRLAGVRTLAFERISFGYSRERPVLSDVSFDVEAGEAIGIVGPSGAGKSTLVQILLALRDPQGGRYLVNGEPVRRFSRADWHRLVAYVPQDPRLLHASVAENVRFFRDLDDEAVERACRLARIHEDIVSWSGGYETIVGPRADAVSGGQQQRLCLARALAARPSVLVLDEPTSALDPYSETLIQESLTALKSELTMFIVAHRMSTLDMCDRVMVILDGRLAAFDTRAVLQEQNPYYRSASMIAAGAAGGMLPD
jgi:ABC-type multidrug transport system fused ATPase/permease subunit